MFKTKLITLTITLALTNLAGCSSKDNIIPPSDTNISEVYKNHVTTNSNQSLRLAVNEPLARADMNVDAYQLHGIKRNEYQYLPNPTLYMYVNHKLSEIDRSPIPAFITEFKMYERDEYALPSEVNINFGIK